MDAPDNGDIVATFAAILGDLVHEDSFFTRLCEAGRRLVGGDGAALTLSYAEKGRVTVSTTGASAAALEDLQQVAGEGPTFDALASGDVVVTPMGADHLARWPLLSQHVHRVELPAALMAIPLMSGASALGALTVVRTREPTFDNPGAAELVGATLATAILQDPQMRRHDAAFEELWADQSQVHQATGMVISQVGVRAEDALALLRAQAFARGVGLLEVAQAIIDRSINFRDFTIEGD